MCRKCDRWLINLLAEKLANCYILLMLCASTSIDPSTCTTLFGGNTIKTQKVIKLPIGSLLLGGSVVRLQGQLKGSLTLFGFHHRAGLLSLATHHKGLTPSITRYTHKHKVYKYITNFNRVLIFMVQWVNLLRQCLHSSILRCHLSS